ncbi:MAG TPA: site-specific integrase [Candidatus Limnocylindria bacterium]
MRGHIQQRGKSWRIKAYCGRDESGRKRYAEKTVRGSRREADRELKRLLAEVDQSRVVPGSTLTLDQLLDRWLSVKRLALKESTLVGYEWISQRYVRPALGPRRISSLRPIDLDLLYGELAARGLSRRTVRICHSVLRQSLEQARRWELIERNPALDASPPPQRSKEVVPPTIDQVQRLIDAARQEDPALATYLWLKAFAGCRRGELCALRWTDIDLDRGALAISRAIVHVGREVKETDTKTHRSRRLALDETSVAVLRQHRRNQLNEGRSLDRVLAADAFLFSSTDGKPWRPDVVTNRFGRLRSTLGLNHVRLHDLRHFAASVLIDGGIPISTVSARLGHRQISTTLNMYAHALPPTDQRAAAYLGGLLGEVLPSPPFVVGVGAETRRCQEGESLHRSNAANPAHGRTPRPPVQPAVFQVCCL